MVNFKAELLCSCYNSFVTFYCMELLQAKLESELSHLKAKVMSMQVDLDNSEAVQRDFVKLSQSLQVRECT